MSQDSRSNNVNAGGAGGFLLFMAVVFAAVAWFMAHDPIARLFLAGLRVLTIPFAWLPSGAAVLEWIDQAEQAQYIQNVSVFALSSVGNVVGKFWWWILLPIVAIAIIDALRSVSLRARTNHTLQSFLEVQATQWAAIVPWLKRDLTHNNRGPMARSLSAAEYGVMRRFLVKSGKYREGRPVYEVDETAARDALHADLGKPFLDLDSMEHYEKALFTVFALRVLRQRKASDELLAKLNRSAGDRGNRGRVNPEVALPEFGAMKLQIADESIPPNSELGMHIRRIKRAMAMHAWRRTMLVGMLCEARRWDGLLQPAEFLWVKERDRVLWYALNRAPVADKISFASFPEGAAVLGCFQAERVAAAAGRKLNGALPAYIEGALKAIKEDLYLTGYIDTPSQNGEER